MVRGKQLSRARTFCPGIRSAETVEKSRFCSDGGKEDSVKETQEGCLSRSINDFFERSLFKKVALSVSKKSFRHAERPRMPYPGPLSYYTVLPRL